jgi:2-methylcitrate dehydratase
MDLNATIPAIHERTEVEALASFVSKAAYERISEEGRQALKIRVLDSLGCGIGALASPLMAKLRAAEGSLGGNPLVTLIGGGKTAPDRGSFYNGALIRYLDFNDSYLAPRETCHPSDNLGAVLAAGEYANRTGAEFLTALAVAYQVQCRLSDQAPVRDKGFDHIVQGAYALAAGVSKALGLTAEQTANAIAISGTAYNALRVTRTGSLSNWKALAYPNAVMGATHAAFLAKQGVTGPLEVIEGNKGFKQAITGPFFVDWETENLAAVRRTIVKRYNAEIHSQSAVEAILNLRQTEHLDAAAVEQVEVEIFDVAFNIIGGGEEGKKDRVVTKEQADHSLPYILAVALLDGDVNTEQYLPPRIVSPDVQNLLRRITVHPNKELSSRFPAEMPVRIRIRLRDGQTLLTEARDYEGFHTRPVSWDTAVKKFERLTGSFMDECLRAEMIEIVKHLEAIEVRRLTDLLSKARVRRAV